MYFSSKNSRVYISLISRPIKVWYLLTVSAFLLLGATWWTFIQKPLNKIINGYRKEILQLKEAENLDSSKYNFNFNKNINKTLNKNNLKDHFKQLSQGFKSTNTESDQIIKIIDQAVKSGLIIKTYDAKPELNKVWYHKNGFDVEIEGNFEGISKLLENINSQSFNLRFLNFVAKNNSDGLINLKMTISILGLLNENN